MVIKDNPLSGEERKIVSTRLYQTEFLYFKKLCDKEGKAVNEKLREMINNEVKRNTQNFSKIRLLKEKEGIDNSYNRVLEARKKGNFEIKKVKKNDR
jgi:hypothetical protein